MKKYLTLGMVALMPALFSPAVFAEEGTASHQYGMSSKVGDMHKGGMCNGMMSSSMVATNDGGIIVSSGQKLLKYDAGLNLVKEVNVPVDVEGMKQHMRMMKEMMGPSPETTVDKKSERSKTL